MPTLPALEVSQAHYDRIVAAFPGATLAEKAVNYQNWQINCLLDEVARLERQKLEIQAQTQMAAAMKTLTESLPARKEYPPRPAGISTAIPRTG